MSKVCLGFLLLLSSSFIAVVEGITVTTKTTIPGISTGQLQDFLGTPSNWPKIVASSHSVEGTGIERPLRVGEEVKEIFGLPPILPLTVTWTCQVNQKGSLQFVSPDGLDGVAKNCKMAFEIRPDDGTDGSTVQLEMTYEPVSPLAIAALPVLSMDNDLALKVLLPMALKK